MRSLEGKLFFLNHRLLGLFTRVRPCCLSGNYYVEFGLCPLCSHSNSLIVGPYPIHDYPSSRRGKILCLFLKSGRDLTLMSRHKILIGVILPMPARSYLYCMFRFWMMFAHALLWVKHAHTGGEHSQNA
jgi:hypothetical protein